MAYSLYSFPALSYDVALLPRMVLGGGVNSSCYETRRRKASSLL